MKNNIILLLTIFIFSSCNQVKKGDFDSYRFRLKVKSETGLDLPEYISFHVDESFAIGDYSKDITLEFDSINFNSLFKQVEKLNNHKSSNDYQNSGSHDLKWKKYPSGYKMEYFDSKENVLIFYYVCSHNQTFSYIYIDE